MTEEIINRVASSPLVTINLEEFYPEGQRLVFDMKEHLFQGLILREKDFREFVKSNDWSQYNDSYVSVVCTADAIVPTWAYMLVAQKLSQHARGFAFGDLETLENSLFLRALHDFDASEFQDKPVVIKGCFDKPIPNGAYMEITRILLPFVKSLMYGEPCSTVPIYKKKAG